jgi:hypothetical protein
METSAGQRHGFEIPGPTTITAIGLSRDRGNFAKAAELKGLANRKPGFLSPTP